MSLKLVVGVSKKRGLPEYSSVGASCNVEIELETSLLPHDLDTFHQRVRAAYAACRQAVDDELGRLQAHAAPWETRQAPANGPARRNGNSSAAARSSTRSAAGQPRRTATANQVRAIVTIARRQEADLPSFLRAQYGVDRPEDLSLAEASQLISRLESAAACGAAPTGRFEWTRSSESDQ
jgi:hypothetical protein